MEDRRNGRRLESEDEAAFAEALREVASAGDRGRRVMAEKARATAESFSLERCARRLLDVYGSLIQGSLRSREGEDNPWTQTLRLLETEWTLWSARIGAAVKSISGSLS